MNYSLRIMLLLPLISASTASAQSDPPDYQPFAQLKEFLQLTGAQVQTILRNNDEFNQWSTEKQTRGWVVQSEIADETVKEALDPVALGVRYVELEVICREMKSQVAVYQKKNIGGLTAAQQAKLAALRDAIKLASIISEAQTVNLIDVFYFPSNFRGESMGYYSSGGAALIGSTGLCYFSPYSQYRSGSISGGTAAVTDLKARTSR